MVERKIYLIRGEKGMLSSDLAGLYGVEPKVLMQAVKRNIERFPEDFMFQLSNQEVTALKSQIVTSSWGGIPAVDTAEDVMFPTHVGMNRKEVI
jgi:hypothetical protein